MTHAVLASHVKDLVTGMGVPWRRSADEFTRILRKHGQVPATVTDVLRAAT